MVLIESVVEPAEEKPAGAAVVVVPGEPAQQPELQPRQQQQRKMSAGSCSGGGTSPERRLRTRSFGEKSTGQMHILREYTGDGMDRRLASGALVKKAIARDNTSLFRAVCEQVSSVQTDHGELRVLIERILRPRAQKHFKDSPDTQFDRDREILAILSQITSSRIKVYRTAAPEPEVHEGTVVEDDREILVAETQHRSVYEPVYTREMHEALAISQAIIYRALYERVFGCARREVDEAVDFIREDIDRHSHSTLDEMYMMSDLQMHTGNAPCSHKSPPFPFCACKSLDPAIYRNVEYDLYRKKAKESEQAAQNSLAVKFGVGARCLARDGRAIRNVRVIQVIKHDVRRVVFEEQQLGGHHPFTTRDFDVSDLRALPTTSVAHHSMHSLHMSMQQSQSQLQPMQQPRHPIQFLPGCHPPPPPPPPPPLLFNMPPPPLMMMGVPFSHADSMPSPRFPPPQMFGGPPAPQFLYGSHDAPHPPSSPPPLSFSPAHPNVSARSGGLDTSSSSALLVSTPLSSRSKDGRKKPRALSVELSDDSPVAAPAAGRLKKSELTWWVQKGDGGSKKGGRRATEGDSVGEMNRPLQPKQHLQQRLSTCCSGSNADNESSPVLPTLNDNPLQLQQQMGGGRGKLPSLLPLPPAQARPSYYASSSGEWTGDDTVFTADEGASQTSLAVMPEQQQQMMQHFDLAASQHSLAAAAAADCSSISVPHISIEQYETVNKEASYSEQLDGTDLPSDALTTRFFYNLGVKFFRMSLKGGVATSDPVCPPPPMALPLPFFPLNSPSLPPGSPMFFPPGGGPFQYQMMGSQPMAPPPTPFPLQQQQHPAAGAVPPPSPPGVLLPPQLPPYIAQYCIPGVEGMPTFGYVLEDGCGGNPYLQQQQQPMMDPNVAYHPMPSPLQHSGGGGGGNFFFPP